MVQGHVLSRPRRLALDDLQDQADLSIRETRQDLADLSIPEDQDRIEIDQIGIGRRQDLRHQLVRQRQPRQPFHQDQAEGDSRVQGRVAEASKVQDLEVEASNVQDPDKVLETTLTDRIKTDQVKTDQDLHGIGMITTEITGIKREIASITTIRTEEDGSITISGSGIITPRTITIITSTGGALLQS